MSIQRSHLVELNKNVDVLLTLFEKFKRKNVAYSAQVLEWISRLGESDLEERTIEFVQYNSAPSLDQSIKGDYLSSKELFSREIETDLPICKVAFEAMRHEVATNIDILLESNTELKEELAFYQGL